jgi:hypothetical protein
VSSVIGIITFVAFYFLPTIIAAFRHRQLAAIFALNLFLGWTVVGWVAALVMSLWSTNTKMPAPPRGVGRA